MSSKEKNKTKNKKQNKKKKKTNKKQKQKNETKTILNMKLLSRVTDWKVSVDLMTSLRFPIHIARTDKRLDVIMGPTQRRVSSK